MNERIDLILDLTRRLSQLVEREIALIQAQEPHRLAEHEEERSRLSLLYAREMQSLRANPDVARRAEQSRLDSLRAETKAFNETLERHQRLIARMRHVTEGIVKAVADEAARQNAPRTSYGMSGYTNPGRGAAPLAINRKI
ncbi:MAG: hypothetical protein IT548_10020 [Alphaproteobacteria bacterium]|nr:hypothetical protein [Alphaproteobacteria bacterium]